ncbi:hypothetical protein Pla123a_42480 [Posidoniimonas polymericola]|uniref:Bacteriophage N4 adsorption protein B n=1 Tax=Posidoniimonas polymericola TaxID=2528002 RepID=A0A5C5Y2B1_9BACT|nr:hypothetical protein [Posidoniimonas polymericola]TWT67692.1 hypothetical protein Pla123a_42480 [Posidoniimonas polymericola]
MRFGLYLYHQKVITAEQLIDAVEEQQRRTPPVGELAIEAGLVSVHNLFEIVRAQSGVRRDRFGTIAMEMGLMSQTELAEVLMRQADLRPPLREILVDRGILTHECADAHYDHFQRHMEDTGVFQMPHSKQTAGA